MAANKQLLSSSTLALVFIAKLYAMQPFSAAQSTSPAIPSAAGMPSSDQASAGPSATLATTALPPSSAATASKKFPLPATGGECSHMNRYLPVAEVTDEFPCCSGGYSWFGGPGGFGPGTYGYNGPLYFGTAPARGFVGTVLVPIGVACVSAVMYFQIVLSRRG